MGIFVINLDRSADRWASIRQSFGGMPWPVVRVAGLDWRLDSAAILAMRGKTITLPPHGLGHNIRRPRHFMLAEEACVAGHMLVWRQFLASGFQHALVLEDDALPRPAFREVVRALLAVGMATDIVKLEGSSRRGTRKVLRTATVGGCELVRSLRPSFGSAGYMITRKAAEQLLARIVHRGGRLMPIDDFLWSPMWHGLRLADVSPGVIGQSGAPSMIARTGPARTSWTARSLLHATGAGAIRALERLVLLWSSSDGQLHRLLGAKAAPWRGPLPDDAGGLGAGDKQKADALSSAGRSP
ncbi:MAG TPA: glycosyltransferase family 25 protein [Xanthobacteraceae bacterium]|nr:glycosyltransferase family 25 protein [Xanthobacteraceae bacterium]